MYFEYGDKEIEYLKSKDVKLARVIESVGHINRAVDDDLFSSVVHHIIGQQISTKAQQTIWNRLNEKFGEATSERHEEVPNTKFDIITYAKSAELINKNSGEATSKMFGEATSEKLEEATNTKFDKITNTKAGGVTPEKIANADTVELQSLGMTFRKAEYIKDFSQKIVNGDFNLEAVSQMSDADAIAALSALKGIGVWTAEMILLFCLQRPNIFSFDDLAIQRGIRMVYHHKKVDRKLFEKYRKRFSPYCSVASLYFWAVAGGLCGFE